MKKILSLIIFASALLFSSIEAHAWYNTNHEYLTYDQGPASHSTATSGRIIFKLNVKDWATGNPVPGVSVSTYFNKGGARGHAYVGISNPEDGIVYFYLPYTNTAGSSSLTFSGYDINLHQVQYTADKFDGTQFFDFDVNFDSYSYDLSTSGKIRNLLWGECVYWVYRPAGSTASTARYHDVRLTSGIIGHGSVCEFDIYVKNKDEDVYVFFPNSSEMSNAGQFEPKKLATGGTVASLGLPDPIPIDDNMVFDGWEYNGSEYDTSTPVNHHIGLWAKWRAKDAKPGLINFEVYMWDHDKYAANPNPKLDYKIAINGAWGYYTEYSYQHNDGWTAIPVQGLRFTLRNYPEGDNGQHPEPIPGSNEITTDEYGKATYTIPIEELRNLKTGYVIDCDPDQSCIAFIKRSDEFGMEKCVFNWDIQTIAVQSAGVMGVRYIPGGPRHGYNKKDIKLSDQNDNDAFYIQENNKKYGFEFTFVCYVIPAPCAEFDVNGGTMPSNYDPATYPLQKFTPINSAGKAVDPYQVALPRLTTGAAAVPVHPNGYSFRGWYEVKIGPDSEEYLDSQPFNFGSLINKYTKIRAVYDSGNYYTVRWAPENWDGTDETLLESGNVYQDGDSPTYKKALPTKENRKLIGWDLYLPDDNGEFTFGGKKYRFQETVYQPGYGGSGDKEMVYIETATTGSLWKSPVDIDNSDQLYIAQFEVRTLLTVEVEGMAVGESAIFTITNGTETRKIFLSGVSGKDKVSKTLKLPAGNWTVTEDTKWSWAYTATEASKQVTVVYDNESTVKFTNTPKETTPRHGESYVNNVFTY